MISRGRDSLTLQEVELLTNCIRFFRQSINAYSAKTTETPF